MTYNAEDYDDLIDSWPHQQRAIAAVVACFGIPENYLDVGCGTGAATVFMAKLIGADRVLGIDHPEAPVWRAPVEGTYRAIDFESVIDLSFDGPHYDLVTCWEVAEHLTPEAGAHVCKATAAAVAPGGVLVWTAAHPGQGGRGHINEQEPGVWRDVLVGEGLEWDGDWTLWLTEVWDRTIANPLAWLRDNVIVMRRPA